MEQDSGIALQALNALPGLGPAALNQLLTWEPDAVRLVETVGSWPLGRQVRTSIRNPQALWEIGRIQESQRRAGNCHLIARGSDHYPASLEDLEHPPPLLYAKGCLESIHPNQRRIAMIGSRSCTPYGRDQAMRMGRDLAAAGIIIVSGLARGIDQCSMLGAARSESATLGILGSGLDRPYPPEASGLIPEFVDCGGCVLSEFPFHTPPRRGNFPRRNRLLAAMSSAVLVIQATPKSGSMITVGWALNLGRDVFALPGPVDSQVSKGPHNLIKEGASLVESATDILQYYGWTPNMEETKDTSPASPVLAQLKEGSKSLDDLAESLQQPAEQILLQLVEMELHGLVVRRPGGLFELCGYPQ